MSRQNSGAYNPDPQTLRCRDVALKSRVGFEAETGGHINEIVLWGGGGYYSILII